MGEQADIMANPQLASAIQQVAMALNITIALINAAMTTTLAALSVEALSVAVATMATPLIEQASVASFGSPSLADSGGGILTPVSPN